MQDIILLVFTVALLYLVCKLFFFVKALQAIQYVRDPMVDSVLLSSTTGTIPGNALSFRQSAGGLIIGATYYSMRNINVSVCNPRSNHTLLRVYSIGSF